MNGTGAPVTIFRIGIDALKLAKSGALYALFVPISVYVDSNIKRAISRCQLGRQSTLAQNMPAREIELPLTGQTEVAAIAEEIFPAS